MDKNYLSFDGILTYKGMQGNAPVLQVIYNPTSRVPSRNDSDSNTSLQSSDIRLRMHCTKLDAALKIGTAIHVDGHLRAGWVDRFGYEMAIWADSVRQKTSTMETVFGQPGKFAAMDPPYYAISGRIVGIHDSGTGWCNLIIYTDAIAGETPSTPIIQVPPFVLRELNLTIASFRKGMRVAAICRPITSKKKENGQVVHHDDFRCVDIQILSDNKA